MKKEIKLTYGKGNRPWRLFIPGSMTSNGRNQTHCFNKKESAEHAMQWRLKAVMDGKIPEWQESDRRFKEAIKSGSIASDSKITLVLEKSDIEALKRVLQKLGQI
jgi:hypothetical protein